MHIFVNFTERKPSSKFYDVFAHFHEVGKSGRSNDSTVSQLSNFNYGPLVWMPSTFKCLNKIDYESSYDELFKLPGSSAIYVRLKRNLCVEIYITLNDLNPRFMWETFETRKTKRAVR